VKPATVNVEVLGLPKVQRFFAAVADLLRALADVDDLPAPVMEACDRIRQQVAELSGKDVGPPP
jgi:hypothetical protein